MKNYLQNKNIKNESGIALVLSVLILANLLMITFVVADIILRIGRSSKQISDSEIAYFSAESGIEQGVYNIEKQRDASGLGTINSVNEINPSDFDGSWHRYIEAIDTAPITCIDNSQKITYPDALPSSSLTDISCVYAVSEDLTPISNGNALIIRLAPGKSFSFDLDIAAPSTDFYPSYIDIDWTGAESGQVSRILSLYHDLGNDTYDQELFEIEASTGNYRVPQFSVFDGSNPSYRILITNTNLSSNAYFTLTPSDNNLPVGISLTSKGYYKEDQKERIIVLERRNWEIY